MTTLKEYKAMMEGATDALWFISPNRYVENKSFVICANGDNWHSIAEVRNGADDEEYGGIEKERLNAKFIVASRNIAPDLIRVIELAEELINQGNFTYLGAEYVFCARPEKVKELEEKIKILKG